MAGEWYEYRLGDLAEIFDGPHATPKKAADGPIFLGISSLRQGRLDLSDAHRLSEEDYRLWTRRVTPAPGDVVFSYETRIGEAALIPGDLRGCLGRRMGLLRVRRERVDSRFLLYAYLGPEFQETLRRKTIHGSTVDRIPLKDLPNFPIRIPPSLLEQRAMAHILGTLDDKIELNRRMSETLEAIARAIFQSWFVGFEPVWAKKEGRQPAGMEAETAALFPDDFEESELGPIPEGWAVGTLEVVANNVRSSVVPEDVQGVPYVGLEHMPRRSIALAGWGQTDEVESLKMSFATGDTLFGKLRPYFHKVVIAPTDGVCSSEILVVRPNRRTCREFVLLHLSSAEIIKFTTALSTGTRMPRTSWSDITTYRIALPPENLLHRFSEITRPLIDRVVAHGEESRTISDLRDLLLPKLLSGELRIPDTGSRTLRPESETQDRKVVARGTSNW